jgi:hypothetical protein
MKGKATWKPAGLRAKRWRSASQVKGPANLLPEPHPIHMEPRRMKGGKQRPYAPNAT